MNSELQDYFDDLLLFFLYVCIMTEVQQNYWFVITVIKSFNQNSLNISKNL